MEEAETVALAVADGVARGGEAVGAGVGVGESKVLCCDGFRPHHE